MLSATWQSLRNRYLPNKRFFDYAAHIPQATRTLWVVHLTPTTTSLNMFPDLPCSSTGSGSVHLICYAFPRPTEAVTDWNILPIVLMEHGHLKIAGRKDLIILKVDYTACRIGTVEVRVLWMESLQGERLEQTLERDHGYRPSFTATSWAEAIFVYTVVIGTAATFHQDLPPAALAQSLCQIDSQVPFNLNSSVVHKNALECSIEVNVMKVVDSTKCPVCNKRVDPHTAPSYHYRGKVYFFKCGHCLQRFVADPVRYVGEGMEDRGACCDL